MRANIHAVAQLPIRLDTYLEQVARIADQLDNPTIHDATVVAGDPRQGLPAEFSLTITGEMKDPDLPVLAHPPF